MKTFLMIFMIFSGITCSDSSCTLPDSIIKLVNQKLQGIELVESSELIEEWRDFLKTPCPTIVEGDFNGDLINDFAFIAKDNKPDSSYQLLIAQSAKETYEFVKIRDIGFGIYDSGLGFGIELFPKGQVQGIDKTVKLNNVGISFSKFESSSTIIYYDGNSYKDIYTGD